MIHNSQKGVSLFLALMIMTVLLAIALGLSAILIGQIKIIRGIGDSVIAFYAADTGIERELYERNLPPFSYSGFLDLNNNGAQDDNDSFYHVVIIVQGPDCDALNHCIRSVGTFKETRRAIEATK